jgi:hypothetical protein
MFYGLFHRPCTRAHHHNHPFGIGSSEVIEQPIAPAGTLGKAIHYILHNCRTRPVVRIDRLAGLKEDIRILRCAPEQWMIGRQCPLPMLPDQSIINQPTQIVIIQQRDLIDFMGSTEAVKEVQERNARSSAAWAISANLRLPARNLNE